MPRPESESGSIVLLMSYADVAVIDSVSNFGWARASDRVGLAVTAPGAGVPALSSRVTGDFNGRRTQICRGLVRS